MSQRIQFIKEINEMNTCQQIEQMKKDPWAIQYIQNPENEVVMAAIEKDPRICLIFRFIQYFQFIVNISKEEYEELVNRVYRTNELMRKKFIRYGNTVRKRCK